MDSDYGLRVCSYNCRGIKSSTDELQQLCASHDIILLQETWLYQHELSYILSLSNDYYGKAISSIEGTNCVTTGRPHGGLAILWRKSLANMCKIVEFDHDRFLGIVVSNNNKSLLLLNVYFPYDSPDNIDEFIYCLAKVDSIVNDSATPYVLACGDFNANLLKDSRFGRELILFCQDTNLIISDSLLCPTGLYTYVSEAHDSVSWLDHILATVNGHDLVSNVCANNSFISSDHLPVSFSLNIDKILIQSKDDCCEKRKKYKVNWAELSAKDLKKYTTQSDVLLSSIRLNHDLLMCDDVHCTSVAHRKAIDVMYKSIIDNVVQASDDIFHECKSHDNQILGWNDVCKEIHAEAREAFLVWCANGKPKNGYLFDTMKRSRATFKYALRKCKANDSRAKADNLAIKFLKKDSKSFWNEIKRINGNDKSYLASTVNGVSGNSNVATMWHDYYKKLLNSSADTCNRDFVKQAFTNCVPDEFLISPLDVKEAVKNLKSGKSAGLDYLTSEHFKFASDRLYILLSIVFKCMLLHGYIPSVFMDTLLIPIVKDKTGDITSGDNYRPIALTSVSSKIVELIIIDKFLEQLDTSCNQFGFKFGLSTELCIFSLKQIVDFYRAMSSPLYLCFLDASKAFDRVNHWSLCKKLLMRNIPSILVRFLSVWFSSQMFCVLWGTYLSNSFFVSNGVRQGGILSPILFNVYIDDLSASLTNQKIGCNFNELFVNHLVYADDTVLIAPSPLALQQLIDHCASFAKCNSILYNTKKTKCMCIRPKGIKDLYFPPLYLNDNLINVVNQEKYLGAFLVDDGSDDADLHRQMRGIYARGNALIKNFKNCSNEVKALLFKTFCSGFYCCALWSSYKAASFNKVKVAYNNIFRVFMNLGRRVSVSKHMIDMKIDPFKVVIRKNTTGFIDRISNSDNFIVKKLYNWSEFGNCQLYRVWSNNVYCLQH